MPNPPSGTVTFLFTDIEGSTHLWEQYPDTMRHTLTRHDDLLRHSIEAHGGYIFKTVGDGFCAAFDIASDALAAALSAQRSLFAEAWDKTGPLGIRMALHTGTAKEHDGDYFGPNVNRVARLLSAGHGRQTLLSLATKELVHDQMPNGVVLLDLGKHRLKDLDRAEHIFQLAAPDLPVDFPPLKSLVDLPNNLPIQLTSFIGREREMMEVKRLLTNTRLLTLTGAGGFGKTRLSVQVAADLLDAFADGVWLVELAPLTDPTLVPQTVASVLGVREEPMRSLLAILTSYLRTKNLLLILDNCEHLIEACARLADVLLRACPNLRILATSREALGIPGETTWLVPSLSLPDRQYRPSVGADFVTTLTQYEAVQLFIDRAVAVLPTFTITNQNAPAVAQICHRLDGIPLAIELAAVRVKVLSVEQIARRLDDRFYLLKGGSRTALPRQQTLQAAIDWSYNLLAEPERMSFRRLSVFAGDWTLEAAEAICEGKDVKEREVLGLLSRLVDKSLVIADELGGERRYRLLETIRQYARDKLLESGETESVCDCHIDFFLGLAEEAEPKLLGREQIIWFERLEVEHDNIRAALQRSQETESSLEKGLRLAGAMWRFWEVRSYLSEGRERLTAILRGAEVLGLGKTLEYAKALNTAGRLAWAQGDYSSGQPYFEKCLTISKELGDKLGVTFSLSGLGTIAWSRADYESAHPHYKECLTVGRELGAEGKWITADALIGLGIVALGRSDYKSARSLFEESLTMFRELGDKWSIGILLWWFGNVATLLGDFIAAHSLYKEAITNAIEVGNKWGIPYGLDALGQLAVAENNMEEAALLFGATEAFCEAIGTSLLPFERARYDHSITSVRAALGEETFQAAWTQGHEMTMEQTIEYALKRK
jgi:predicted ATPase/class 3 adenylate cyclase